MHVCMYVCVCLHVCMCMYAYVSMYACVYVCVSACIHQLIMHAVTSLMTVWPLVANNQRMIYSKMAVEVMHTHTYSHTYTQY